MAGKNGCNFASNDDRDWRRAAAGQSSEVRKGKAVLIIPFFF